MAGMADKSQRATRSARTAPNVSRTGGAGSGALLSAEQSRWQSKGPRKSRTRRRPRPLERCGAGHGIEVSVASVYTRKMPQRSAHSSPAGAPGWQRHSGSRGRGRDGRGGRGRAGSRRPVMPRPPRRRGCDGSCGRTGASGSRSERAGSGGGRRGGSRGSSRREDAGGERRRPERSGMGGACARGLRVGPRMLTRRLGMGEA